MKQKSVVAVGFVVLACLGAVTPAAATATQEYPEESFVVDLQADGSATTTTTVTFDLADETESDAFAQLRDDRQARERIRSRFSDRMAAVASDASNATGREMSITNASLDLRRDGSTGIVELSVTWANLAALEDGQLTVTEPFASGFEPDREFRFGAPEGYEITTVDPQSDGVTDGKLTWNAGTSLDGFEITVDQSEATTDSTESATAEPAETSSGDGPGFGVGLAAVALLGTALLARRD